MPVVIVFDAHVRRRINDNILTYECLNKHTKHIALSIICPRIKIKMFLNNSSLQKASNIGIFSMCSGFLVRKTMSISLLHSLSLYVYVSVLIFHDKDDNGE